jgi:serine/threonine-protein kinase
MSATETKETKKPVTLGNYTDVETLAKGGMGTVFKARHSTLHKDVVIKKLSIRNNPLIEKRFAREARLLMDLNHPNIVRMYEYSKQGSSHYLVLEYIDGCSLDKILAKRKILSPQIAMYILRELCKALSFAHKKGIVHRDIKPGNILISKKCEIKLTDFGIATGEDEEEGIKDAEDITKVGVTLGTPAYMAPEQRKNSKFVDLRADVYALGIMLYEMVLGEKPFPSDMSSETDELIQKGKYIHPSKKNPELPRVLNSLIGKMIKPKQEKRYQTVDQVQKIADSYLANYDIIQIRKNLASMVISDKFEETPYSGKKKGFKIAMLALFCSALLLLGMFFLWQNGFIHKYLLKSWFDEVTIELTLPKNTVSNSGIECQSYIFDGMKEDLPEIKTERRRLYVDAGRNCYVAKPVYLKKGNYRIKCTAGPYVWWQSFSLDGKNITVSINLENAKQRKINVYCNAIDKATGKKISSAELYLNSNGKWIYTDTGTMDIPTGTVQLFQVTAPGYREQNYSLYLESYQDELYINAELEKK